MQSTSVTPNFSRIVACCRAESSRTLEFAELQPISSTLWWFWQ